MLNKIFKVVLDAATLIFILGTGIALGRFFSMFTERAGMYLKEKLSDNVYSVISIICSLLLIALVFNKVIVG